MPDKKTVLLGIYRLLTPKHKAELLTLVRMAYSEESSEKKSISLGVSAKSVLSLKTQDFSCENSIERRKK